MIHFTPRPLSTVLLLACLQYSAAQFSPSCLTFDGVDDHVTISANVLNTIGTGDFTLEAWVLGDAAAQIDHGRMLSNAGTGGAIFFFHDPWGGSNKRMLALGMGNANYLLLDNGTLNGEILDGQCHHVAIARDNDSIRFFMDGMPLGVTNIFTVDPSPGNASSTMAIGSDLDGTNAFEGQISQLRIFNFARTSAQMSADMDFLLAPGTPGLIGYWELNEGGAQIVEDGAGLAHGTLGDATTIESSDPTSGADCCTPFGTIGLDEIPAGQSFTMTYDPATQRLQVTLSGTIAQSAVRISDASGRTLLESVVRATPFHLDVAGLPAGSYLVTVVTDERQSTQRFVK